MKDGRALSPNKCSIVLYTISFCLDFTSALCFLTIKLTLLADYCIDTMIEPPPPLFNTNGKLDERDVL